MDTISFTFANIFRDNASVLMALLVFLATGTTAFSAMAFVRVRGAVKRRTTRILDDGERAARPTRSLRYSSLKAVTQLIEYTTKHYSGANEEHMKEEEEGPLVEFDDAASADEQAQIAGAFAAFETEHAGARGITIEDKDPDEYVAANTE